MSDDPTPPPPDGPPSARGALPAWLYKAIRQILRRMHGVPPDDRDDIAQEAALHALRCYPAYQPERGSLRAWLRTIVRRVAARFVSRKRNRRESTHRDLDTLPIRNGIDPEARLAREELLILARLVAAEIPDEEREALLMQVEGMSIPEIAAALDLPETTIHGRLNRARHHAMKVLQRWQASGRLKSSDLLAIALLLTVLGDVRGAEAAEPAEPPPRSAPMARRRPLFWRIGAMLSYLPALLSFPVIVSDPSSAVAHVEAAGTERAGAQSNEGSREQGAVFAEAVPAEEVGDHETKEGQGGGLREAPAGSRPRPPLIVPTGLNPPDSATARDRSVDELRAADHILAALRQGRMKEARRSFAEFERSYPGSAYATRIRKAVRASTDPAGP